MLQKNIKWKFNIPLASHHGGAWERQIRSIKKVLAGVCSEQLLTDEALSTVLCEVECILNSRPLTTVSNDPQDLEPLTPNHLLLTKNDHILPPGLFDRNDLYSRKRWRLVQYLVNLFWTRWTKEYFPLLQERAKWNQIKPNLKCGDIVLLVDSSPRNNCMLGRVLETLSSGNKLARSAIVQTQHGIFKRPITKLCLVVAREDLGSVPRV